MDSQTIYQQVNDRYGATARASSASNGTYGKTVAQAFGYSAEELASIPQDANLGLSCGNPIALANIQEGETVVDLGSGAGFDVFLAAKKVGDTGRAIGVDINDDMLTKAAHNASHTNFKNTLFLKSNITSINLPSSTADVIISNCVINLVPAGEKPLVFREMFRLLKPGGRVAVSDLLAKKPLPEKMRNDVALYVGCIAGASMVEEYEMWLREAGFRDAVLVDAKSDLNVYLKAGEEGDGSGGVCCGDTSAVEKESKKVEESCCSRTKVDGGVMQDLKDKYADLDLNEWLGSYKIYAVKPVAGN